MNPETAMKKDLLSEQIILFEQDIRETMQAAGVEANPKAILGTALYIMELRQARRDSRAATIAELEEKFGGIWWQNSKGAT